MNPLTTTGRDRQTDSVRGGIPSSIEPLLRRFVQLAREIEPYLQDHADESIYIDYRQGSWTAAMLEQFRREIYIYPAAMELLQYAADNAGVEVNYREFLVHSSSTDTQIRSELGAISKVARKLFGNKVWPVRTRQGKDGVMRYYMPEGIAEWWTGGAAPSRTDS